MANLEGKRAFEEILQGARPSAFSPEDGGLAKLAAELSGGSWDLSYERLGGRYLARKTAEAKSGLKEGITLYPHQQQAVQKILAKDGNLLLSHPVGSGKTLSAIAAFETMKEHGKATRALVVVPASLRTNFLENGVKKFTNSRGAIFGNAQEVAQGTHASPSSADPHASYHIVSYDMFRSDPKKYIDAAGADTVIYDELHRAKEESTSTSKSIKDARQFHRNFIGLTGSIVSNTPADIVPLIDAMTDGKHMLGNKTVFESRFVRTNDDGSKSLKHPPVVKALLAPYVHHVDPKDLQTSAPKKIIEEVRVDMSPHQTQLYRFVTDQLDPITKMRLKAGVSSLNNATLNDMFSKLIKLRQLSNSVHTLDTRMTAEKSAVETPKIKRVIDDIHDHLKETPDGQAVVHTNLVHGGVDVISAGLTARGIDHALFIGKGNAGITEKTRQHGVKEFQEGKKRVIVLSAAGGEGLDLPNATFMAMVDGHFNPERINQAEARGVRAGGQAHRPEGSRQVVVRRYVSVLPSDLGHKVQVLSNLWDNINPAAVLERAKAGAPAFYNPFKKEPSTDEWIYGVAKRKAKINTELHGAIKTSSMPSPPCSTHEEFEERMGMDKVARIRTDIYSAAGGALLGGGIGAWLGGINGPTNAEDAKRDPNKKLRGVLAGAASGAISGGVTGLLMPEIVGGNHVNNPIWAGVRAVGNVPASIAAGVSIANSTLAPPYSAPHSVREIVGDQPRTYTDRHIFEKYWEHFGDELTAKEDLTAEVGDKAMEAKFVRALKDLYAEGLRPTSRMTFRHKDDAPVESKAKFVAKELLNVAGVGAMGAFSAMEPNPALMALSSAPPIVGAISGGIRRYRDQYVDPGVASSASRVDTRKRARFNDEDLVKLLRGRAVDEVKIKSHAIG